MLLNHDIIIPIENRIKNEDKRESVGVASNVKKLRELSELSMI